MNFDEFLPKALASGATLDTAQKVWEEETGQPAILRNPPSREQAAAVGLDDKTYDQLTKLGWGQEAWRGLKRGGGQLVSSAGTALDLFGGDDYGLRAIGGGIQERNYGSSLEPIYQPKDYSLAELGKIDWFGDDSSVLNPNRVLGTMGEFAPSIAASIGPGALARGIAAALGAGARLAGMAGTVGAATSGGLLEGLGVAQETLDRGGTRDEALSNMGLAASYSALAGALPAHKLFGPNPSTLKYMAGEALTEMSEEPVQQQILNPENPFLENLRESIPQMLAVGPGAFLGGGLGAAVPQRQERPPSLPGAPPPSISQTLADMEARATEADISQTSQRGPATSYEDDVRSIDVLGPVIDEAVNRGITDPVQVQTLAVNTFGQAIPERHVAAISQAVEQLGQSETQTPGQPGNRARALVLGNLQSQANAPAISVPAEAPVAQAMEELGRVATPSERYGIPPGEVWINPDTRARVEQAPDGKGLVLSNLYTEPSRRGRGSATRALKKLTGIADRNGVPIRARGAGRAGELLSKAGFSLDANGDAVYAPRVSKASMRDVGTLEDLKRKVRSARGRELVGQLESILGEKEIKDLSLAEAQKAGEILNEIKTELRHDFSIGVERVQAEDVVPLTTPGREVHNLESVVESNSAPEDLNNYHLPDTTESRLIGQGLKDLERAGMGPLWREGIDGWHVMDNPLRKDLGSFDRGRWPGAKRKISISEMMLSTISQDPMILRTQVMLRQTLAHEMAHGIDFSYTGEIFSVHSPRFRLDIRWISRSQDGEKVNIPSQAVEGDILLEMLVAYVNDAGGMREYFDYPFAKIDEVAGGKKFQADNMFIQYEAFAQLAGLYFTKPDAVRRHLPLGYEFMREVQNAVNSAESIDARNSAVREIFQSSVSDGSGQSDLFRRVSGAGREVTGAGVPGAGAGEQQQIGRAPDARAIAEAIVPPEHVPLRGGRNRGELAYPPGVTEESMPQLREEIAALALEGADARFWYKTSANRILQVTENDLAEAEKLAQVIAVTSPRARVPLNTDWAVRAYEQVKKGQPIQAGRTGAQIQKLNDILLGNRPWNGKKTNSFYINLMMEIDPSVIDKIYVVSSKGQAAPRIIEEGERIPEGARKTTDPVTIDIWMARAFGYGDGVGQAQYEFAERETAALARALGWSAHEAQAAVWVAMKARWESLPRGARSRELALEATVPPAANLEEAAGDYATFLDRATSNVTWEVEPGDTTGISLDMSPQDRRRFLEKAVLLIDENGRDGAADRVGIPFYHGLKSIGSYQKRANPNVITGVTSAKQRLEAERIARELLGVVAPYDRTPSGQKAKAESYTYSAQDATIYSLILQRIYKQNAVPWFRADPTLDGESTVMGVRIRLPKELTEGQAQVLAERLGEIHPEYGFTKVSDNDIVVLNYKDPDSNKPFGFNDAIFSKAMADLSEELGGEIYGFKAETYYRSHDWGKDPKGVGLEDTISALGRSDLLPWVRDRAAAFEKLLAEEQQKQAEGLNITEAAMQPPKNTVKAYKLFRTLKSHPGDLYPLFIGKTKATDIQRWVEAEFIPTKGYQARPGWHTGILPIAPHLRTKDGKIQPGRVWAEVEIPADVDWQTVADAQKTKDIRDRVPEGGHYKFRVSKMQGGAWMIGGAIKVNKVLTNQEVAGILGNAGFPASEIEAEMSDVEWAERASPSDVAEAHQFFTREEQEEEAFEGPNRPVVERPADYFEFPEGTMLVPLDRIRPTRARPKGIQNANKFMVESREVGKRKPVSLQDNGDGTYTLLDGNSTYANAAANSWLLIPAQIEGSSTGEPFRISSRFTESPADSQIRSLGSQSSLSTLPPAQSPLSETGTITRAITPSSSRAGPYSALRSAIEPPVDQSVVYVPTPVVYHDIDNVDTLLTVAGEMQPRVAKNLRRAAKRAGVEFGGSRVKGRKRIDEKLKRRKPNRIGDYLGARLVVDSPEQFEPAIEALRQTKYQILEVDDFRLKPKGGYRAVHVQAKDTNTGVSFEVQILPRATAWEQDNGESHKLYEQLRALDDKINLGEELTQEEVQSMYETKVRLLKIHGDLWLQFNEIEPISTASVSSASLGPSRPSATATPNIQFTPIGTPVQGLPQYAGDTGSINLDKLSSPEEIKATIDQIAREYKDIQDTARRGVRDWGTTERVAEALGMTPRQLAKRKLGAAFNAEQIEAARTLMEASAADLHSKAVKAARTGAHADKLLVQEALLRHVLIQSQYSGIATEAGRALNILRKRSAQASRIGEVVEEIEAFQDMDAIVNQLALLDTAGQLTIAARDMYLATKVDMLLELWINALLSGPQTHATNMLSNALVGEVSAVEHWIAAGLGKLHGGEKVSLREAISYTVGGIQGAREGLKLGARAFWTEEPQSSPQGKVEARRYQSIPGYPGKLVRIPGRLLMAEDEFFKSMGYRRMLNALAMRQALSEGLSGGALATRYRELVQNPPSDLEKRARDHADYLTFTNKLGSFGVGLQRLVAQHPYLRILMPFIRTPTNIVKFAAKRTPLGLFFRDVRGDLSGKRGNAARDLAAARILFGSGLGMLVMHLVAQGLVTGGGPDDTDRRNLMRQKGWQPYSMRVGDEWQSFARLEPLGMLLGISADMVEMRQYMTEDEEASLSAMLLGSIMKNLTSKTWLRGLSEAIQAIEDPDRYAGQWLRNLAGTVVPTGVAQTARVQDPILRDARNMLDTIKARVPGKSEEVVARLDLWGNEIYREGGVGPDLLSPIYTSRMRADPAAQALLDAKYYPSKPSRKIGGVELTPAQYYAYQQAAGRMAHDAVNRLAASPGFQAAPEYIRKDTLKDAFTMARRTARVQMMSQYPSLRAAVQRELLVRYNY